jgi:DNA polymerase I-like protein with 3'-5' exonuclease and polymerase domains
LLGQLLSQTPTVVFFNASFDVPALEHLGHTLNRYEDAMLLAYSCGFLEKGLEDISHDFLHLPYTPVKSQWRKSDQGNIGIDHVKMAGWSIQHAINTLTLWNKLPKSQLYTEIDRPSLDLVIEMEQTGLLIDQVLLTEVEQDAVSFANKLEEELKFELGDINLASNPQVVKALQLKGIIGTRKTKGGASSVSDESLKPLNNPVANKLLKWRSVMKTITTYIPAFRNVDYQGKVYTTYRYTDTGRWRSGDKNQLKPNLQNITRDEKFEGVQNESLSEATQTLAMGEE